MLLELPGQPRLADPGDTEDGDESRPAVVCRPVIGVLHDAEVVVTSDERRLECARSSFTAPLRHDALRLPEGNQLLFALELVRSRRRVRDGRLRRTLGGLSDEHRSGLRERLDPRGRVHEIAGDHSLTLGAQRHRRLAC